MSEVEILVPRPSLKCTRGILDSATGYEPVERNLDRQVRFLPGAPQGMIWDRTGLQNPSAEFNSPIPCHFEENKSCGERIHMVGEGLDLGYILPAYACLLNNHALLRTSRLHSGMEMYPSPKRTLAGSNPVTPAITVR